MRALDAYLLMFVVYSVYQLRCFMVFIFISHMIRVLSMHLVGQTSQIAGILYYIVRWVHGEKYLPTTIMSYIVYTNWQLRWYGILVVAWIAFKLGRTGSVTSYHTSLRIARKPHYYGETISCMAFVLLRLPQYIARYSSPPSLIKYVCLVCDYFFLGICSFIIILNRYARI